MTTFIRVTEDDPLIHLVVLIESILTKPTSTSSTSTNKSKEGKEKKEKKDKVKDKESSSSETEKEKEKEESDEEGSDQEKEKKKKKVKKKKEEKKVEVKEESNLLKLAKKGSIVNVLNDGFFKNLAKILQADPNDIDAAYSLVYSILEYQISFEVEKKKNKENKENKDKPQERKKDEEKINWREWIPKLSTSLSSDDEKEKPKNDKNKANALCRLKLLSQLFNLLNTRVSQAFRLSVFVDLLRCTYRNGLSDSVAEQLAHPPNDLQQQLVTFQSSDKSLEVREMNLLLSQIFQQANRLEETQKHRILYLQSMQSATKQDLEKASNIALEAIKEELASKNLSSIYALMNLKIVQSFAKSSIANQSNAFQLLNIFANEDVKAYDSFFQEKKAFIKEFGLSHEELLRKIRILTLSSLGGSGETVSYETLRGALQVKDNDEVEIIIIDAVRAGRLDAKIDQENQQVFIERVSPRAFAQQTWKQLSTNVQKWTDDVARVLQMLQDAQFHNQAQAGQVPGN